MKKYSHGKHGYNYPQIHWRIINRGRHDDIWANPVKGESTPYIETIPDGALRFPWLIPYAQPKEGAAEEQQKTFEILKTWEKPVHFIFGANDPIFLPSWGRSWAQLIPRATFAEIEQAGHFLQEDASGEIVTKFLTASNSSQAKKLKPFSV